MTKFELKELIREIITELYNSDSKSTGEYIEYYSAGIKYHAVITNIYKYKMYTSSKDAIYHLSTETPDNFFKIKFKDGNYESATVSFEGDTQHRDVMFTQSSLPSIEKIISRDILHPTDRFHAKYLPHN